MNVNNVIAMAAFNAAEQKQASEQGLEPQLANNRRDREARRDALEAQQLENGELEVELASLEGKHGFLGSVKRKREDAQLAIDEGQAVQEKETAVLETIRAKQEDGFEDMKSESKNASQLREAMISVLQRSQVPVDG